MLRLNERVVLADISRGRRVGSGCCAIRNTKVPDLIDVLLVQIQWIHAAGHVSGRSERVAEGDVRVGELGAEQAVHAAVVAGDREVAPEHRD